MTDDETTPAAAADTAAEIAAARAPHQTYSPHALVEDVEALLRERGLDPRRVDIEKPGARSLAASMLLRSLDITPAIPMEQALDLDGQRSYNRRVHGD